MKMSAFFMSLVALAVAACGDSDSFSPTPPAAETINVVTTGPISGFGSVVSNGIEFGTDSATILINGDPGGMDDLHVGMIVSIRGTIDVDSGIAEAGEIRFGSDVEGPIAAINSTAGTLSVLGQTVLVDELTMFDETDFDSLAAGNVVRISGQLRSQDRIQATHIHRMALEYQAGMRMQIRGEIEDLDPVTLRFRIGDQVCDYSGATLDLGGSDLADGLYVEVTSATPLGDDGDMILDRIQAKDRDRDRDQLCSADCDFELEGFITAFVSATEFDIDGQPVTTTASTEYIKGTVDSLALDTKVAVDGLLDANGTLVADRIVFRLPSMVEIEADVEALDPSAASVTLLGLAVTTTSGTMFRDHSSIAMPAFGYDDLATGDRLEVRAYLDGDLVVATRIERDDADDNVTLRAPVEAIDRPSLALLGVMATSGAETVFQNTTYEVIDADTFFGLVAIGDLVKAEGSYDGSSILAEKMFLRECEEQCR
jgi:hypothetical protein